MHSGSHRTHDIFSHIQGCELDRFREANLIDSGKRTRSIQGSELDRFSTEFESYLYLQIRVQVLRILFFEFKFEFGKNDRVQERSSGLYRSQWHEQINDMQLLFW